MRIVTLHRTMLGTFLLMLLSALLQPASPALAASGAPVLTLAQEVTQEPLLGGTVTYTITARNTASQPVTDRGYNLTIVDTLPVGLSYTSATPTPTIIEARPDGTTRITWDNVAYLEAGESQTFTLSATLASSLTVASTFTNQVSAQVNTAPDNSGTWINATAQLSARPQAIDIEAAAQPSTAVHQVSGAGEYPTAAPGRGAGADWPYRYQLTIRNNQVGNSDSVVALATLPPGTAYLGSPTISPNPNNSSATPSLTLLSDGSLELRWSLGRLTTTQYTTPIVISFSAAIPYRLRTSADTAAASGPFAGPMSGAIIPEGTQIRLGYEATATYASLSTADGSSSTPTDDAPINLTADYLTVKKSASPSTVGIGTTVTFNLDFFVSEYYTATNVLLTDVLPDGMTYTSGFGPTPDDVRLNTPGLGQTTLIWNIAAANTTAGKSGMISFRTTVDSTYEAAPYIGAPVVSGDALTNHVQIDGDWQDVIDPSRTGATTPDQAHATIATRMPTFSTQVWDPIGNAWAARAKGFTGDTMRFRLRYNAAADVDARAIIIRDFLPRGMTYVAGSATHTVGGIFSNASDCTSQPTTSTIGTLSGLQYLEWMLCNTAQGSSWEAIIDAKVGDIPNVQPGWIVANFGKLSGQNSHAEAYSLRDMAITDYAAPDLLLTKTASPNTNLIAGSVVTYTITVKNQGQASAYNLVVGDTVPADLLIPASGGTGSPTASGYTAISGNPAAGQGGRLQWSMVAALAAGATQTFRYTATIPAGLPSGAQMTNLASVSFNSRADGTGHQWPTTSIVADNNTDDETVYLRGMRVAKSANVSSATIGDVVHWTLTGTLPPGQIAYWPTLEENTLPDGFDYIPGSTVVTSATLDTTHHTPNPIDDNNNNLRWFLQTIDNTANSSSYIFTVTFDTLVTGVKGTNTAISYYPNNCCLTATRNSAYVGWYDGADGYNNQGFGYHGFETNRIDRRSPRADYTLQIRQPSMALAASADRSVIGAGDTVTFVLQSSNGGNSDAYDIQLGNTLPTGLTYVATQGMSVRYPVGFPATTPTQTNTNTAGSTSQSYGLDMLPVGATWTITMTALVDPAISAALDLSNRTTITAYSSRPGTPPDSNGDRLIDERTYSGPTVTTRLITPVAEIAKRVDITGELTFGTPVVYTLTIPSTPINAWVYTANVQDLIDPRLTVESVSGGSANGNTISASFVSIAPNQQQTIIINARLGQSSSAHDNDIIRNKASLSYTNGGTRFSNEVASTVVAPALMVEKSADRATVVAGDVVTYTLQVANVGSGRVQNLSIADALPSGLSYISGSARDAHGTLSDPSGGAWPLAELRGNSIYTITFQANVTAVAAGEALRNTARATGQDSLGNPIPANNITRVLADGDVDDQSTATIYGPLTWTEDRVTVVYEDLKKFNWSDWDYNDFVTRITIRRGTLPDGNLAVVQLDYTSLARGAGFLNHSFSHHMPFVGSGWYRIVEHSPSGSTARIEAHGYTADEPTATIFTNTRLALPQPGNLEQTNTRPDQTGVIAGRTATLIVALNDPQSNPAADLPRLPWDPYMRVNETNQEIHLVQPGYLDNTQTVTNRYDRTTPLLGYDLPLAQAFSDAWRWPSEFIGVWRGYAQFTTFIKSGGTKSQQWYDPLNATSSALWGAPIPARTLAALVADGEQAPTSRYFSAPISADLNGDGIPEIIIGNMLANQLEVYDSLHHALPGWPQAVGGAIRAAATVANIDADGYPDVLVGSADGKIYAWHANGSAVAGWPVQVGLEPQVYRILAAPAVGDIDGDSKLDIVVPLADGRLYAFSNDGTLKSGWPVTIGLVHDQFDSQISNSSPQIIDIDGDNAPEIIVGSTDGRLYVYTGSGTLRWSYSSGDMILGAPAVAEIDPNHAGKEIVFASGDSYVYLLAADGTRIWRRATGWTLRSTPAIADLDRDGSLEILVGGDDHKLWAWHYDGTRVAGWPQVTAANLFAAPSVGDINGDGTPEVVVGSDDGMVYAWSTDGTAVPGWPQATGEAVKGAPRLVNLDRDPALEVVAGSMNGQLYIWGATYQVNLPSVSAP